jgi:ureidoglycolate lyase
MTRKILASPLTPEAFAPWGQVLASNGNPAQRDEYAASTDNLRDHAKLNITFMRVAQRAPQVKAIERHPHSMQLFVPMNGACYLAVVCPALPDGRPDIENVTAFVAHGGQAVNYDAGAWHGPLCVLDRPGDFTMIRHDDGGPEDTELVTLDETIEVLLP